MDMIKKYCLRHNPDLPSDYLEDLYKKTVLRIRDVYPDPGSRIPDPNFSNLDPGSSSKNFNPKNGF
jgi:hypothetical protein